MDKRTPQLHAGQDGPRNRASRIHAAATASRLDRPGRYAANIDAYRKALGRPVAFETGTNYLRDRYGPLSDGDFFSQVRHTADCGILLDLHNIWCNELGGAGETCSTRYLSTACGNSTSQAGTHSTVPTSTRTTASSHPNSSTAPPRQSHDSSTFGPSSTRSTRMPSTPSVSTHSIRRCGCCTICGTSSHRSPRHPLPSRRSGRRPHPPTSNRSTIWESTLLDAIVHVQASMTPQHNDVRSDPGSAIYHR